MQGQRKYSEVKIVSSTNGPGTTWNPHAKRKKKRKNLDSGLTHFNQKVNSEYISELNLKCKTMKLPDGNKRKSR